jgi:hypothetical protein
MATIIDARKPSDRPVDIFGSRTPTTPPTSAPTRIKTVRRTPKSFILGSIEERKKGLVYCQRVVLVKYCREDILPKYGEICPKKKDPAINALMMKLTFCGALHSAALEKTIN